MKPETYPDYVSYEIDWYYYQYPYGPDRCPMCAGDLTQTEIEPSRAMRDEIARTTSKEGGYHTLTRASFLYICNDCRWWCVRDACQFIDDEAVHKFAHDYLAFAVAGQGEPGAHEDTLENTQPWLKALDDPDVYSEDVLRRLPKELSVFIYKQPDSPESAPVTQPVLKDISEYDRLFDKTRELVVKKQKKRLRETEPVRLSPGDKVRITDHAYGRKNIYPRKIVAIQGSIGTVLAYDEYHGGLKSQVKKWAEEGTRYPVRLEMVAAPSEDDLAFWRALFFHTCPDSQAGKIHILDADCLEKVTGSSPDLSGHPQHK